MVKCMLTIMNLMVYSRILLFLVAMSGSNAQDLIELSTPPSSLPTSVATSTSPTSLFQNPSSAPTTSIRPETLQPTSVECGNTPGWYYDYEQYYNCSWNHSELSCDDDRVSCWDNGNLGYASHHCCKCKYHCDGKCNDPIHVDEPSSPPIGYFDNIFRCDFGGGGNDDYYSNTDADTNDDGSDAVPLLLMLLGFSCLALIARVIYCLQGRSPAQQEAQQTMAARRQQQRENNTISQGLTEEERNHARYELFVTRFYFQTVLPDKSNITANSIRSLAPKPDEETLHSHHDGGDDDGGDELISPAEGDKQGALSRRLSSWRRPSAKDECCICLECYLVGETICAPITEECNHVFHEECINEWLKNHDKCPLCRVELLQ